MGKQCFEIHLRYAATWINRLSTPADDIIIEPFNGSFFDKRQNVLWLGTLRIQTSMNIDLPVRFTVKVALAAGYLVYGNLFRHHADHQQLRDVMRIDPAHLNLTDDGDLQALQHITVRIDHCLREPPPESDWALNGLRAFCSDVRGSVVILVTGDGVLGVTVGLLGQFLATVIAPADTKTFPNEGAYAWGHVLAVTDGKLRQCSWLDALTQWVTPSQKETT